MRKTVAILLILLRLGLAGVLLVAGIAKLADLPGSRQAMRDFGLPAPLAAPVGLLLPLAEIAVALLLLPATTAWWAALGAVTLLGLFVAGIGYNLARGRTPNCHCFGQLHSQPIGTSTLIRNDLLILIGAVIVAQGSASTGPSMVAWLTELSPLGYAAVVGGVLLLALAVVQSWVVFNLLRQNGRLLLRLETVEARLGIDPEESIAPKEEAAPLGLPVGSPAPAFRLPTLNGEDATLSTLLAAGKPVLMVFSSPTCGPCVDLLPELAQWQRTHAGHFTLAVVNRGEVDKVRAKVADHALTNVLVQKDNEVAAAYQSTGTPSAVLIAADGKIRSPLATGLNGVRDLVKRATQPIEPKRARLLPRAPIQLDPPVRNNGLALGTPALRFELPDLAGQQVSVEELRGTPTALLFWNPNCGFCRRMADDLKAWEAQPAPGAPRLLLISTGSVEANNAMGLRSPILLDQGFATGSAFGARGTPAAVLLDADGNVASSVTVGAPAVLSLLRGQVAAQNQIAQPVAA
jgi:thiol-disulfide isomerase/thioredoxin/uncharacterized membrane protein YphA (DoxX/SURF4 family)